VSTSGADVTVEDVLVLARVARLPLDRTRAGEVHPWLVALMEAGEVVADEVQVG
jgi:hypothetical protein